MKIQIVTAASGKILDAKNIKRLLDEENDGLSEDFKREFVECFDDIMENPR